LWHKDNYVTLNTVFRETELLIATHCENEQIISANKEKYQHADNVSFHPLIRNEEACFASSFSAVQLAKQNNTRLHILHITTAKELQLFSNMLPLKDKQITNEVCVHHLHFTANDYEQYGNLIQCNPAIKASNNRDALWEALLDDRLDIIATDHAPHTWEEKQLPYGQAPSGLPLVQHSLPLLLSYVQQGKISIEKLVEKMCHAPAVCFELNNRGYIREGYAADLVLINPKLAYQVNKNNIYYKCSWSPLEGMTLPMQVITTFVNGHKAYDKGVFDESVKGQRLQFR
jgi:dihydroorotase